MIRQGVVTPARWVREFLEFRLLPFQLLLERPDARRGQGVRDAQWDPSLQIPKKTGLNPSARISDILQQDAPCRADPHLWVSLGGLPTASVGAGERDASAFFVGPLLFLGGGASGAGGSLEKSPPAALLLCVHSCTGGMWSQLRPGSHGVYGTLSGLLSLGGASQTHPSFLTGQLWDRPHDPEHLLWRCCSTPPL